MTLRIQHIFCKTTVYIFKILCLLAMCQAN